MDLNLNTGTPNFDTSGTIQTTQTQTTSATEAVSTPTIAGPPVDEVVQSDQTQQATTTTYNAPTQSPQLPKPGEEAPKAGTPNTGTPNTGTPNAGTPNAGTPNTGTPNAGTPNAGTPKEGTPNAEIPKEGAPKEGTPDAGTTKAEVPKEGVPDKGTTPNAETPKEGTQKADTPQDGTTKTETPKEGIPQEGAVKTATPKEEKPVEDKKDKDDKKDAGDASGTDGTQQDGSVDQGQVDQDKGGEGGGEGGGDQGSSEGGDSGGGGGSGSGDFTGSNQGGGSQDGFQEGGSNEGFISQGIAVGVDVETEPSATPAMNLSAAPKAVGVSDETTANAATGTQAPAGTQPSSVTADAITEIVGADKLKEIINIFYSPPVNPRELGQNLVSISNEITDLAQKMAASMAEGPDKFRYVDFLSKVGDALRTVQSMLQKMQMADSTLADKLSKMQLDKRLHQIEHQRSQMEEMHRKQAESAAKQATMGLLSKIFAFLIPLLIIVMIPMMIILAFVFAPIEVAILALLAAEFIDCCATVAGKPTFALQNLIEALTKTLDTIVNLLAPNADKADKQKATEILKFIMLAVLLVMMCVVAFPAMVCGGIMVVTDIMQKTKLFGNLVKACGGTQEQADKADTYAGIAVGAVFAVAGLVMLIPAAIEIVGAIAEIVSTVVNMVVKMMQMAMQNLKILWSTLASFMSGSMPRIAGALNAARAIFEASMGMTTGLLRGGTEGAASTAMQALKSTGQVSRAAIQGGTRAFEEADTSFTVADKGSTTLSSISRSTQSFVRNCFDKLKSILRQMLDPEFLIGMLVDTTTVGLDVTNTVMEVKFYKLKGDLAILQAQIDADYQLADAHIKLLKKVIQDLLDSMAGFSKEMNAVASLNKKIISGQSNVVANLFSSA